MFLETLAAWGAWLCLEEVAAWGTLGWQRSQSALGLSIRHCLGFVRTARLLNSLKPADPSGPRVGYLSGVAALPQASCLAELASLPRHFLARVVYQSAVLVAQVVRLDLRDYC